MRDLLLELLLRVVIITGWALVGAYASTTLSAIISWIIVLLWVPLLVITVQKIVQHPRT